MVQIDINIIQANHHFHHLLRHGLHDIPHVTYRKRERERDTIKTLYIPPTHLSPDVLVRPTAPANIFIVSWLRGRL